MSTNDSIMFNNNLVYKLPVPSSVRTKVQVKKMFPQKLSYAPGETIVTTLQTGTDFIDPTKSALVVKVSTQGAGHVVGFGTGSAMNLFNAIRIQHKSGTELCNVKHINLYQKLVQRYQKTAEWSVFLGALQGYGTAATKFNQPAGQTTHTFVIPLESIHPIFKPLGGQLMPPQMCSGLHIELDTAPFAEVFLESAAGLTGYTIDSIHWDLNSVAVQDAAQASLNSTASKTALEYMYHDIFSSVNSLSAATGLINIDLNKAVSFCSRVDSCIRPTANLNNIAADQFATANLIDDSTYQYRLGSTYYPNQKVSGREEIYYNSLIAYDKLSSTETPPDVLLTNTDNQLYSVSLEKDGALALSESAVNSSRSLNLNLELSPAPAAAHVVTSFVTYVTAARFSLLSATVDI